MDLKNRQDSATASPRPSGEEGLLPHDPNPSSQNEPVDATVLRLRVEALLGQIHRPGVATSKPDDDETSEEGQKRKKNKEIQAAMMAAGEITEEVLETIAHPDAAFDELYASLPETPQYREVVHEEPNGEKRLACGIPEGGIRISVQLEPAFAAAAPPAGNDPSPEPEPEFEPAQPAPAPNTPTFALRPS